MKLSNRNKGTLFQRSVSQLDGDNRNTSGMTSRKRSDASMRRTEVYSPSLRREFGNFRIPYISTLGIRYTRQRRVVFSAPDRASSLPSSSSPTLDIRPRNPSISRGKVGIPKWRSGMTRRTRSKTLPDRWSGNAFTRTVARTILTQVIIAIGYQLDLRVKFAVRRAVSDSETICSLNCMRLHVARSLPKRCQRWEHACYRKSLFLTPLREVGYIKIDVYKRN